MSRRRQPKRPPLRSCRSCGGDVYAWQESPICGRCLLPAGELLDLVRRDPLRPRQVDR